ncbi:MAG: N-acetylmuramoyl-L-alanine amidase, partial [Gammaproteobacteria bacterium SHHR-1]
LVLDLKNARLAWDIPHPASNDPHVRKVRTGIRNGQDLRIVFDLKQRTHPSSRVESAADGAQRIFIELGEKAAAAPAAPAVRQQSAALQAQAPAPLQAQRRLQQGRDIIIAIDAGHGGKDPGAIGPRGTKEKDVTLAVARKLAAEIDREEGMRAVLVRDKDEFIRLRDRILIARKQGADLFVSIHADAFKDRRVRGSSVFTLSRGGASSEAARWLADRENAADLVGGVTLDDKDDMLASVLLDLSQSATLQAGNEVANKVFGKLSRFGKVHGK